MIKDGPEVGGQAEPHLVGVTARLRSVVPLDAARLRVETEGVRRFRIATLHHDRPYLWANIEYPVDEVTDVPEALIEEATQGYRLLQRLRQTIESRYQRDPAVPGSPGALADAIGAAANEVAPPDRLQPLLEMLDVHHRLESAVELLNGLVEFTHQQARDVIAQRWAGVERRN
ncbi:MAG TPA: LON peptidase substrate-binding domain-containing protein [Miltoncostaeaceae bacterium]|nr:LON peptidase substrate-binding domain-containing protein [Miltoncostaeaceae bacterium]